MRDQDLEQRLRTAVEHAAPDPLDRILSSCDTQKGTVIPMKNTPPKKKKHWAPLATAAALLIMCTGVLGANQWRTATAVTSVVCLDVNPCIQLQVNQKEKVLAADAMNEDAQVILADMDLKGTQLNVAVNAIVGSLLQNGYLDSISSAILISVEDADAQRASRLETTLTEEVNAALVNASAGAAVLSQVMTQDAGLETQAQANSISVGKAALIQRIQALNGDLAFEDLAELTVEELKQLEETGAPGLPIGKAAAAGAAEKYAGTLEVNSITWEADAELDKNPPHYEVELHTAWGDFEYRIGAYTGEVLKGTADIAQKSQSLAAAGTALISESKAKSIALSDAGVKESAALGLKVKLDWEDGIQVYEVEFRANSTEYEYEIDASSGVIRAVDQDSHTTKPAASTGASYIGETAAKTAALSHAGVAESATKYCNVWLEYDDGRPEHYEVEFRIGGTLYKYEISLYEKTVLECEKQVLSTAVPAAGTSAAISQEKAKSIAFADAGVNASDVTKLEVELDEDDGAAVYQIEFQTNSGKYEYEIDASTGAVLKAKVDGDKKKASDDGEKSEKDKDEEHEDD